MGIRFPEANYFIASSRLRPGMDGGYTVSTLRRAQQFADHAGVNPVLLTFDFWPDYDRVIAEFSRIGLMGEHTVVRNLLQDARSTPQFLRERVAGGAPAPPVVPGADLTASTDHDARGRPWRTVFSDASGVIAHTDFLDHDGRPVLRVPYLTGRADWHRAPIAITVFDEHGEALGALDGFGDLYRCWMRHVLDTSTPGRLNAVVCESRQVGELLVDLPDDNLRLVHTVHSAHVSAPYRWDSPIDGLWASWFEVIDGFDAVIWLTEAQRRDVERRFGPRDNFWIVPHAVDSEPGEEPRARDANLAVMIGRLVPLKRVDHALRSFQAVVAENPDARLLLYGEGPDEQRLRLLARDLGIAQAVEFRGHRPDATEQLARAAALVLTSTYEGQPLVILEAFAHGCPVVSYDINYGPADMVTDGQSGVLVPDGDIESMAAALTSVLGHPEWMSQLSTGARAAGRRRTPEHSMRRMADVFAAVLAGPRARRQR